MSRNQAIIVLVLLVAGLCLGFLVGGYCALR